MVTCNECDVLEERYVMYGRVMSAPVCQGLVLLWLWGAATGCSDAVQMVRETPSGGLVTYSYKEDRGGHLMSRYRRQADALMMRKCPAGYRVIREGEARGYTSVSGSKEGTEDEGIGRKWGVQFECKAASGGVHDWSGDR
ncbi:MAG: hypothetical protein NW703_07510 [Nitrospiraceae bacterium]